MAKDPRVNHYRSGKNPHQEVVVFNGDQGTAVHVVDWRSMRVQTAGIRKPAPAAPVEEVAVPIVREAT